MELTEKIKRTAELKSELPAYIGDGERLTYGELWERASALAKALFEHGDTPVLIYGKKSASVLISIVACLISRRAYVPVEEGTPRLRLENIAEQTGAALVLSESPVSIGKLKSLKAEEILKIASSAPSAERTNDTAYIIFTSGTTGKPKGVPVSYSNLENFTDWLNTTEGLGGSGLIVYNQASFSFDLSVAALCLAFGNGGALACSEKEPGEVLPFLKSSGVNAAVLTPTMLRLFLLDKSFSESDFPELRLVYLCGERLETSTAEKFAERFPKARLINAYGPTEATSAVCAVAVEKLMFEHGNLPVGRISSAASEIRIDGGEIVLKGKNVAKGYLIPEGSAFFREGGENCYRTGDCGKIENDLLYCLGRLDRQVKYKGYRVEPEEIESVLMEIPGVSAAAVVAKKKDGKTLYLRAFVALEKPLSPEEIKNELRKSLPEYMVPKAFAVLKEIPLNKNGKLDRKRLEEL